MRLLILLCLGGVLACAAAEEDFDVIASSHPEAILMDEARWKVVFECLMERRPCGDFQPVKDAVVRIYASKCEKCTLEQKARFGAMKKLAAEKYPKDFGEMLIKYAPKSE